MLRPSSCQRLAAEPTSPYHIIADLQITNDLRDGAKYFDDFYAQAGGEHALGAVYTQMNGFVINPDLRFCDAFGFAKHGGTDHFDWLGDFGPASDEHYVIDGLEDLQRVFLEDIESQRSGRRLHENAHHLAEALVIVKFQRFLQSAKAHMTKIKCPCSLPRTTTPRSGTRFRLLPLDPRHLQIEVHPLLHAGELDGCG